MPKRGKNCDLEIIAKKLRKLEKEVKRSRREERAGFPLSSSSSSSSSSSDSTRHRSSREPSPDLDENLNCQDTGTDIITPDPLPATDSQGNENATDMANVVQPVNHSTLAETECADMNSEILDILGGDPSVTVQYGPDINKEVATRLSYIATVGLNKDMRNELVQKYLIPANCVNITAPQLNAEIKAALSEFNLKRDKGIENKQKQIAAGIACLGKIISDQLNHKDKNNNMLKELMDASRIFCDLQRIESGMRRSFALNCLKKDLKEQLSTTTVDKYLFGSNLNETLKVAKAVSKSSSDLKPDPPKKLKPTTANTSSQRNLNWKARTAVRRQPPVAPPRHQIPAPSSAPPPGPRGASSQAYAQRQKQTRRR